MYRVKPELYDRRDFPGSLCFRYSKQAAGSPYPKGSFIVQLEGDGASSVSKQTIIDLIHPTLKNYYDIIQSETFLSYVLSPIKSPSQTFDFKLHGKTKVFDSGGKQITLLIFDPTRPSTTFVIDWVPITVKLDDIKPIITSFCHPIRISQDANPTRFYVTTYTNVKEIPYWIHTSNLIGSDDTLRSLKVSVSGRKQMCMYCESFNLTWQMCPKKKEVKKTRKQLHLKWSKQFSKSLNQGK